MYIPGIYKKATCRGSKAQHTNTCFKFEENIFSKYDNFRPMFPAMIIDRQRHHNGQIDP